MQGLILTVFILTVFVNWIPGFPSIIVLDFFCSEVFHYLQCSNKSLEKGFFHSESQTVYFGKQHFKYRYNTVRNYVGRQKPLMFSAAVIQSASKNVVKPTKEPLQPLLQNKREVLLILFLHLPSQTVISNIKQWFPGVC